MEATVRPVAVGDFVTFVDALGQAHQALVTAVWGSWTTGDPSHGVPIPALNVVYVSDDEAKFDSYGRQIERATSIVHQSNQAAHGMFWRNT